MVAIAAPDDSRSGVCGLLVLEGGDVLEASFDEGGNVGKLSVVEVILQDVVAEVLCELLLIVFLLVCMDELLDFFDVSVESGSLLQSQTLRRSQVFLTKALKLFLRHRLRIR